MTEESGPLSDLERLVGLAFELRGHVATQEHEALWSNQVIAAFKGVCLTGDGVIRVQPRTGVDACSQPIVWNPTATAALTRVLMEAAVNVHYFSDDNASEDERDLRAIVATIHFLREREDTARELESGQPPEPPIPDDWSDVPPEEQPGLLARMKRNLLPTQLAYWQKELAQNSFFKGLPRSRQEKWLCGKGLFKNGRYIGSPADAGFVIGRHQRAERAGASGPLYRALHRHLSTYVHTSPHALDQARWFHPVDRIAMDSQIALPLAVCAGYVALATRSFLGAFPACTDLLDTEKAAFLETGERYFRCFNP